jgi:hypothetical protein
MRNLKVFVIIAIVTTIFSACQKEFTEMSIKNTKEDTQTQDIGNKMPTQKPIEVKKVEPDEIEKHIQKLIKNGSRKWNTESELAVASYLKEQMDSYGYKTYIQEFPAYEFDIKASGNGEYFNLNPYNSKVIGKGHNVIADINTGKEADKVLVLTAHYDTVSKELGIIDNTSGVLTLLETARLVSDLRLSYNLRLIFFSSEERYLYGSKYYLSTITEDELSRIAACINIDMVGYKGGQELILATPYFAENINAVRNSLDGLNNSLTNEWHRIFPELNTYVKAESASDHFSFEKKEIPNMMITQKYFDMETVRKKDSDLGNLSISELEHTINLIEEYIKNLNITKIEFEHIPLHP